METAKYIGLYLLKNHFCYLHGLGNLELKKKPAEHDGQTLQGPLYEVVLSTTGSIDDSLANFIATHEQTSISKASNALRDFSIQTRTDLQAGKEVVIPGLGKYVEQNGVIRFITDPHLQYTPPSIPILRTSKRVSEAPSFKTPDPADNGYAQGNGVNWGKIGLAAAALALVIIAIVFAVRYFNDQQPADAASSVTVQDTAVHAMPVAPIAADTNLHDTSSAMTPAAPVMSTTGLKVILNTYATRTAAERRIKTLTNNGNQVELLAKDSTNYLVLLPISAGTDTTKALDSLRRLFNPKGVSIYR